MKRIRQLKVERKAKYYITDEEFKKLTSHLDKSYYTEHRDFVIIHLLLDSGMRLGECTCLTIENLDLTNRRIFLQLKSPRGERTGLYSFHLKPKICSAVGSSSKTAM